MTFEDGAVVLTGGSGHLGRLIAGVLLRQSDAKLILPVRDNHNHEALSQRILDAALNGEHANGNAAPLLKRLHILTWSELFEATPNTPIEGVVHCAGSMSYNNPDELHQVNVELTRDLLTRSKQWGVKKFVYLSTAFASGFRRGVIREGLHEGPFSDPSDYTRTKRLAEEIVAQSDMDWLILRPAIVIGDSKSGIYGGREIGIYQLWAGVRRLFFDRSSFIRHLVAPPLQAPLLHEDAFIDMCQAVFANGANNKIIHLAPEHGQLPTVQCLTTEFVRDYQDGVLSCVYDHIDDLQKADLDPIHRIFYRHAAGNLRIMSHEWHFDTSYIRELRKDGHDFAQTTLDSVIRCQRWYMGAIDAPTAEAVRV